MTPRRLATRLLIHDGFDLIRNCATPRGASRTPDLATISPEDCEICAPYLVALRGLAETGEAQTLRADMPEPWMVDLVFGDARLPHHDPMSLEAASAAIA